MTSKHTPGPWVVQKAEDCMGRKLDALVKWVVTGHEHDLWISTGPTWDPEHAEESEANARLIAAAPELLEVVQKLESYYGKLWDSADVKGAGFLSPESVVKYDDLHAEAARAIAKATGEA